jgi:hypothetical protein
MGGLPTLPADNLRGMEQTMAAGGIVAFDEGGEVPRYQSKGLVDSEELDTRRRALAGIGAIPIATAYGLPISTILAEMTTQPIYNPNTTVGRALGRMAMGTGAMTAVPAVGTGATIKAGADMTRMTPEQRRGFYSNPMMGAMSPDSALAAAIMNAGQGPDQTGGGSTYGQQMANVAKTVLGYPGTVDYGKLFSAPEKATETKKPSAVDSAVTAAVEAATKEQPAQDGTRLRPGTGAPRLSPIGAGITGLTQTATGTAQELQNIRNQFSDELTYPQQQAIDKYRLAREGAATEGLKALETDIAKQGLGMEGVEARAKAREAKLVEREGQAVPMAMVQAGLAIMGGESPYAMSNIGRGGGLGLKAYAENIDKLELARDKLDETFSKIEAFRENRADMNAREIRAAKADIRNTKVEAEKYGLEWIMKNSEMNRADARTTFDIMSRNRLGILGLESQERIAAARNAMYENIYGQQNRLAAEYGRLQKAVMASLDKSPEYQTASAAEKDKMETMALAAAVRRNPFLSPYGMGLGFTSAPTGGRVLKLPGDTGED